MKSGWGCLLGLLALAGPRAAPDAVLPLVPYQDRQVALHADIHGHAGLFLFDTGEGMTMISPALAAAIGCVPWGNITALRMLGERLIRRAATVSAFPCRVDHSPRTRPSCTIWA
jgi:hypothetical protein